MLLDIVLSHWPSILVASVVGWLLYVQFIRKFLSPLNKLPGPTSWSLFGNIGEIIRDQPIDPFLRWCNQYGGIIRYNRPFGTFRVAVMEPSAIKHILVTHSIKYSKPLSFRKSMGTIVGNGLLTSVGREHALQRKLINPAFKYNKLKGMVKVFQHHVKVLLRLWQDKLEKGANGKKYAEIGVQEDLSRLTLDVICQCAFGYHSESLTNPDDHISNACHTVLSGKCITWKDLIPLYSYLPTKMKTEREDALRTLKNKVNEVIEEKTSHKSEESEESLLDILMSLREEDTGNGLSQEELYDQVVTFMLAGQETTSACLSWTLYALSQNNEIQEKVRAEVRQVLNEHNYEMTWDILDKFVYLNKVIRESLRLYPPAPLTIRVCVEDDVVNGYFIPKGTPIFIITPHRWEKYYPDALTFNPDRWDNVTSSSEKNINYTFMPFLVGPRSCIGDKFALAELKCALALILDSFSFNTVPDKEVKRRLRITMKPYPSLVLRVSSAK